MNSSQHIEIITLMLKPYQTELEKLIVANADVSSVGYKKEADQVYGTSDAHYINRNRILTAIQFAEDKKPYETLVRYLFAEDVKDRKTNSFQGVGENLELATWLMKHFYYKKSDDALFADAKTSNFDTHCGFNAADLHEDYFQTDIGLLDINDCIQLALQLNEKDTARQLVTQWVNEQTMWDEDNLRSLSYYRAGTGDKDGQLEALEQIFELKKDNMNDWDYCVFRNDIAEKQIALDRIGDAFETLLSALPRLEQIKDWKDVGLGRFIMERCMDIIIKSNDNNIKSYLWQWAGPVLQDMKNLHWNLYEKGANAAAIMNNEKLADALLQKLQKEKDALTAMK